MVETISFKSLGFYKKVKQSAMIITCRHTSRSCVWTIFFFIINSPY